MSRSFVAEVVLTHPDFPIAPTLEAVPDASVSEESVRPPTSADVPAVLYRVTDTDFQAFESALDRDHTVAEWSRKLDFGDVRMYRVQLSAETKFVTPTLSDLGIHVVGVERAGPGWYFRLEAADRDPLGTFWDHCRAEDIGFELEAIRSSGPRPLEESVGVRATLTDRQLEVARVATRMGYYDRDGASSADVAAELGISRSTLSTHLRRINAKLFDSLFGDESE